VAGPQIRQQVSGCILPAAQLEIGAGGGCWGRQLACAEAERHGTHGGSCVEVKTQAWALVTQDGARSSHFACIQCLAELPGTVSPARMAPSRPVPQAQIPILANFYSLYL
jgi:hypothetical protein